VAEVFQPISLHPYVAYISYVRARLARDPEVRRYYERFMKVLKAPDARFRWFLEDLYLLALSGLRFCGESPDSARLDQAISFPLGKNVLVTVPVGRSAFRAGCAVAGAKSHLYGPTKQLAEEVLFGVEGVPQRLKQNSLQSIYVRPEGRTLQENEFFRSL
jgi:hypothetical protein